MPNLFLNKMSQLVDFIHEAPGLASFVHSIGRGVRHWLLTKKVILLLDWLCLLIGLLSVVLLTVMNFPVTS